MKQVWDNPPWYSSYEKNNYGELFYALMRLYQPRKIVELGTKAGYSAYHMAKGLHANGKGRLDCYDLWEKYEFNSVPKSIAEKNLQEFTKTINLHQQDVLGVEKEYKDIDILHVDLGNHGQILADIIPRWLKKVRQVVIVEGGSAERDRVEWMLKYKKQSIAKWLEGFSEQNGLSYFTIEPFPSVTIIQKNENSNRYTNSRN